MVRVTTSIKIDNDKRELAKRKGLVLSDILDQALDFYLGIELKESTQFQKEKEEILNNLEALEIEKEKFFKDHESKIQSLEDDKEKYLQDYKTKVMELKYNLKNIEDSLQNAIIEDKEETRQKEYDILLKKGLKIGGLDDRDLKREIEEYADKYELNDDEYEQVLVKLKQDIIDNW